MFGKIQMILMMKTSISNNRISRLNNWYPSSHNDSMINMSINNNCYPNDLKLAEVSPVFKKKDDLGK